jgi:putative transposase
MARALRIQVPGIHHVTTRGNNGQPIYIDDQDRRLFVRMLDRIAGLLEWRVHLWCLMTNHFHLLVEIKAENLAQGMQRLNGRYAQAFNHRYGCTGHLFERRYASRLIQSEGQLQNTALYIVQNPVVADVCDDPRLWRWTGGPMLAAALQGR